MSTGAGFWLNEAMRTAFILLLSFLLLGEASPALAQDTEPRRWTHLPTGQNIVGSAFVTGRGDIFLDPVLEIEDAEFETYTAVLSYVRSFGLLGRTARVDVTVPYTMGRWNGLLSGEPASTRRHGFNDPGIRLSWLLYGGEALTPQEFATTERSDTIVGVGLGLRAPLGEYYPERLINLGSNRWTIRPQIGFTHQQGKWAYELTGSVFIYTDNDNLNGSRLEVDPLWAIQGHLIRYFNKGRWASLSSAWGDGADQTVDGQPRDISTENWLVALAYGFPINQRQSFKLAWVRGRTQRLDGSDFDTFSIGFSWRLP